MRSIFWFLVTVVRSNFGDGLRFLCGFTALIEIAHSLPLFDVSSAVLMYANFWLFLIPYDALLPRS